MEMMRYSSMTNTVLLVIEILIVYYSVIYSVIFTWRTMTLSYTEISYNISKNVLIFTLLAMLPRVTDSMRMRNAITTQNWRFSYSYPTTYPMIMITNYSKRGFVR